MAVGVGGGEGRGDIKGVKTYIYIYIYIYIYLREEIGKDSDMGHALDLTCDIRINKQHRHATLAFLKFNRRHGYSLSRAPPIDPWPHRSRSVMACSLLRIHICKQ